MLYYSAGHLDAGELWDADDEWTATARLSTSST